MFDALLSGRLRGVATLRTAANGSPYATFRLGVPSKTGESLLCSCVTFSKAAIDAVQSLDDGDSGAVTSTGGHSHLGRFGRLYHYGLELTVHGVMTAYHTGPQAQGGGRWGRTTRGHLMTPDQAHKEAQAAAVEGGGRDVQRVTAAAAVHFTGRPLFQRTVRLRGSRPLVFRIMPPGVSQVVDPS